MAITREELIAWACRNGWTLDRWNHLQKTNNGTTYRLKLSRIAARYELKSSSGWVRIRSGYYKNLTITDADELTGLTR